ncbi:MAG: lipid-A-disaccharide synthase [Cyanobacteria bacterium NC_groundwater_1444_Ag_S-0.65um_54_12]|nr:lipid-A-disaccharide synthase [Cyanobacteria bacterium NC_groundwater_1444_Ag_S-0.65um_54_12]
MKRALLFLAAGEVSGDLHGAALAYQLRQLVPELELFGWGSHRMASAGVTLLQDLTPHAAVGLTENFGAIRPTSRALRQAHDFLVRRRPAAVILIDYQGANMRLARRCRRLGIRTIYYIAPQEWIWGFRNGARKVARQIDLMLAIFEQEAAVYRRAGGRVEFIGHPLLDQLPDTNSLPALRQRNGLYSTDPVLGIFPGSRRSEIIRLLPAMLKAVQLLRVERPKLQVILPLASPLFRDLVTAMVTAQSALQLPGSAGTVPAIKIIEDATGPEALALCTAALLTSGTVTLEAAIAGVPAITVYRVSGITAWLARHLFKLRYISLPNIVANRLVLPELLQEEANPHAMATALAPLLDDEQQRAQQRSALAQVRAALGEPGAIARAAAAITKEAGLRGVIP